MSVPVVIPVPQQSMSWLSQREGVSSTTFKRKWGVMLYDGMLSKGYIRLGSGDSVLTTEAGARFRMDHVNRRATTF